MINNCVKKRAAIKAARLKGMIRKGFSCADACSCLGFLFAIVTGLLASAEAEAATIPGDECRNALR
jgi:hypothetical protein